MLTLIIFIIVLAVLVLSHEFGHFIVARKSGIKVEEFGFGFPPRLIGIHKVDRKWRVVWGNRRVRHEVEESEQMPGTVYSINLIPLGGFVKIKGEDATDAQALDPDSFASKKAWQKAAVLVAGVFMNIVVATVLLSIGFIIGLPTAVDDANGGSRLTDKHTEIIEVVKGSPAEQAGLLPGDTIARVGDIAGPTPEQLREYTRVRAGEPIPVTIRRDGETFTKDIKPVILNEVGRAGFGIRTAEIGIARYPWYQAIWQGVAATGFYLKEIVIALFTLIKDLVAGAGISGAIAGPVGVAVLTGQAARLGFTYLLQLTVLLSLNLAVLNILPIPALDGGRLLFVIISKIIRRPVTPKIEQLVHTIGFVLLMLLVLAVTIREASMFKGALGRFVERIF